MIKLWMTEACLTIKLYWDICTLYLQNVDRTTAGSCVVLLVYTCYSSISIMLQQGSWSQYASE